MTPPSTLIEKFYHGSNRDVDAAAEKVCTLTTPPDLKYGVMIIAPSTNTAIIYIGKSTVTADTTEATDGIPVEPGTERWFPIADLTNLFAIAAANNQKLYWWGY